MNIKSICHILNYKRKNGCFSYRKKRLDPTKLLYSGTETRNACAFSHNVDFWSSGPRRRMNLVEWASSGDCPQTASDAAGGKNRRRRQRSRRRSRFIAPAGARPPSTPPSAFTQRHPRFSIDNPEHPRRTWESVPNRHGCPDRRTLFVEEIDDHKVHLRRLDDGFVAEDANGAVARNGIEARGIAAQRLGRRGQDLVAPPLAGIRRIAAEIRLVAAACDLPRLDRRIMSSSSASATRSQSLSRSSRKRMASAMSNDVVSLSDFAKSTAAIAKLRLRKVVFVVY